MIKVRCTNENREVFVFVIDHRKNTHILDTPIATVTQMPLDEPESQSQKEKMHIMVSSIT